DFEKDQTAAVLAHLQAIPVDAAIEDLPLAVPRNGDERGVVGRGVDGLAQLDCVGLLPGVVRLALHASGVARIGPGDRAHGADHALPDRAFELEVEACASAGGPEEQIEIGVPGVKDLARHDATAVAQRDAEERAAEAERGIYRNG